MKEREISGGIRMGGCPQWECGVQECQRRFYGCLVGATRVTEISGGIRTGGCPQWECGVQECQRRFYRCLVGATRVTEERGERKRNRLYILFNRYLPK